MRRQNPLELVFEDISTFNKSENPVVGSSLGELDSGKKLMADDLVKKAAGPPGVDFVMRNRLNKSKDRKNNISPLPTTPPANTIYELPEIPKLELGDCLAIVLGIEGEEILEDKFFQAKELKDKNIEKIK